MSLSSASALLVEEGRVVAPASCGGPVIRWALWQRGWGHGRGAVYGWWWFEWVSLGHSAVAHFLPIFGSTYFVVFAGICPQRHIRPLSGSLLGCYSSAPPLPSDGVILWPSLLFLFAHFGHSRQRHYRFAGFIAPPPGRSFCLPASPFSAAATVIAPPGFPCSTWRRGFALPSQCRFALASIVVVFSSVLFYFFCPLL